MKILENVQIFQMVGRSHLPRGDLARHICYGARVSRCITTRTDMKSTEVKAVIWAKLSAEGGNKLDRPSVASSVHYGGGRPSTMVCKLCKLKLPAPISGRLDLFCMIIVSC